MLFAQRFEELTISLFGSLTRFTYKNSILAFSIRMSVHSRTTIALLTHGFKLKLLKIKENCKESFTQMGVLQLKERSRTTFMCVGKRDAHLRQPRFTLFRTRVFHATTFQLTFHASPEE